MSVIEVTKDTFEAEVLKSDIPVLADFNAAWCGPCRSMKPMLDELAEGNTAYKIVSIDIDAEDELGQPFRGPDPQGCHRGAGGGLNPCMTSSSSGRAPRA